MQKIYIFYVFINCIYARVFVYNNLIHYFFLLYLTFEIYYRKYHIDSKMLHFTISFTLKIIQKQLEISELKKKKMKKEKQG